VKSPNCRHFVSDVWTTGLGHGARSRVSPDNESCLFAGTLRDGSDGTRTRDLRRDRPNQAPRRLVTYSSERRPLQVFFRTSQPGAAWLSQSSNRRLGHEWATKSCRRRQRGAGPRSDRDPLAERRQHRSEIALPGQDRSQPPGRAELEGQSSLTRPRFPPREVHQAKVSAPGRGGPLSVVFSTSTFVTIAESAIRARASMRWRPPDVRRGRYRGRRRAPVDSGYTAQ
jgi:hypothetical protein